MIDNNNIEFDAERVLADDIDTIEQMLLEGDATYLKNILIEYYNSWGADMAEIAYNRFDS